VALGLVAQPFVTAATAFFAFFLLAAAFWLISIRGRDFSREPAVTSPVDPTVRSTA